MPNVHLPGIQEFPRYGPVGSPDPLYSDPDILDTDYYPGGCDIESDVLPPPKDFPLHSESPSPPEQGDEFGELPPPRGMTPPASPRSTPPSQRLCGVHRYLPPHQYSTDLPQNRDPAAGTKGHGVSFFTSPPNQGPDFGAPNASRSNVSDGSTSDRESGEEGRVAAPDSGPGLASNCTQHTEV